MKISAVILTKNEEVKIEKAIKSLSFCDEVVVVDDLSSDRTVELAKQAGAVVYSRDKKKTFSGQRNWGMEKAKNDWVLFVDADEEVSGDLKSEIMGLKLNAYATSYAIPRRDFFWGHEMKFGETKKARNKGIVRLVKKGSGVWVSLVHEEFISSVAAKKLKGFLNHYSHDSISSFVQDINQYSTLRAEELFKEEKTVSGGELLFVPFGKFIYTYFILGGFLDGPAGFVYSFVMAFHSFLVRAKLHTLYD